MIINHKFISFSSGQIYYNSCINLHPSPSTGILVYISVGFSDQLPDGSVGSTLHQYRRGHGFKSCSGLNFFQALISQLLKLCVYCNDQSKVH